MDDVKINHILQKVGYFPGCVFQLLLSSVAVNVTYSERYVLEIGIWVSTV